MLYCFSGGAVRRVGIWVNLKPAKHLRSEVPVKSEVSHAQRLESELFTIFYSTDNRKCLDHSWSKGFLPWMKQNRKVRSKFHFLHFFDFSQPSLIATTFRNRPPPVSDYFENNCFKLYLVWATSTSIFLKRSLPLFRWDIRHILLFSVSVKERTVLEKWWGIERPHLDAHRWKALSMFNMWRSFCWSLQSETAFANAFCS